MVLNIKQIKIDTPNLDEGARTIWV
jgi:hypothetical protein